MRRGVAEFAALACVLVGTGCQDPADLTPAERGEREYRITCIACHNPNPTLDGAVGPAIAGSSRDLVEARILRAGYPEGYTPKRDTNLMPPQPHLAAKVDDITAFLQQADGQGSELSP